MGNAVKGLKTGIAFRPENFFSVAFQQHGSALLKQNALSFTAELAETAMILQAF
jgi:hypothetical protein